MNSRIQMLKLHSLELGLSVSGESHICDFTVSERCAEKI